FVFVFFRVWCVVVFVFVGVGGGGFFGGVGGLFGWFCFVFRGVRVCWSCAWLGFVFALIFVRVIYGVPVLVLFTLSLAVFAVAAIHRLASAETYL
ncbi:hypothetical protein, partial [Acinetobacter baumannii]